MGWACRRHGEGGLLPVVSYAGGGSILRSLPPSEFLAMRETQTVVPEQCSWVTRPRRGHSLRTPRTMTEAVSVPAPNMGPAGGTTATADTLLVVRATTSRGSGAVGIR
ncbi:unnamed protein product, partial [Laminaria digitata]